MSPLFGIYTTISDLPVRGSIGLLYGLTSPFVVASLALGIFISTMAVTQMQAMQMPLLRQA
ncbi:hypothetical protein [Thermosinus carboxydivorans]|uniref:hypothetical protein n=1 Tax=Thermosinus carboxydivorans TaxID=261685 RepID=UPI00031E4425|nr:hypothetical protein [Thermosinus carboxydivorans]